MIPKPTMMNAGGSNRLGRRCWAQLCCMVFEISAGSRGPGRMKRIVLFYRMVQRRIS